MNKPWLALRDIGILLKFDPQNAAAYQNQGHAFFQLRQWRQEIEAYTKVIELNPNLAPIYVDRGAAHFFLGEDDLALKDFNHALQMDPHEKNALIDRKIVERFLNRSFDRSKGDQDEN
jgi:tetratricopeptide (TPR) repeat protein